MSLIIIAIGVALVWSGRFFQESPWPRYPAAARSRSGKA